MGKGYLLIGVVVVMTTIIPPPPPLHSTPLLSGSFHITDRLNREEKRYIVPNPTRRRKKIGEFYRQGTSWIG
jgi:hypothetical protein